MSIANPYVLREEYSMDMLSSVAAFCVSGAEPSLSQRIKGDNTQPLFCRVDYRSLLIAKFISISNNTVQNNCGLSLNSLSLVNTPALYVTHQHIRCHSCFRPKHSLTNKQEQIKLNSYISFI